MNRFRSTAVWATLVWLAVGVSCASAVEKPESEVKLDSTDKIRTEKSGSIPLSTIVTTSPQCGMLHTKDVFPQKSLDRDVVSTNGYLRQILQDSRGGASNVFLVDAVNARSAIAASCNVFVGGRSADTAIPVNKTDPPRGNHWLVVYLGVGPSSPTWWKVVETNVEGKAITLNYHKAPPSPATADVHPYFFWVPLGKISPGTYEVKLFNTEQGTTTLVRSVEVLSSIEKGDKP